MKIPEILGTNAKNSIENRTVSSRLPQAEERMGSSFNRGLVVQQVANFSVVLKDPLLRICIPLEKIRQSVKNGEWKDKIPQSVRADIDEFDSAAIAFSDELYRYSLRSGNMPFEKLIAFRSISHYMLNSLMAIQSSISLFEYSPAFGSEYANLLDGHSTKFFLCLSNMSNPADLPFYINSSSMDSVLIFLDFDKNSFEKNEV